MNAVKLIALDLDGTLFNSQSQISAHNIDTIKKRMKPVQQLSSRPAVHTVGFLSSS